MKKYYIFIALALALVLPSTIYAEENDATSSQNESSVREHPPVAPEGQVLPRMLREKLGGNIGQNEDMRNQRLENRGVIGSSTRPFSDIRNASNTPDGREFRGPEDKKPFMNVNASSTRDDRREQIQDIRQQGREDIKNASSSEDRKNIRKEIRKDEFAVRKEALSKQLDVAIQNLKQIRERINARITKSEQAGDDMVQAKSLLVLADAKIVTAEQALATFKAYVPTASSTATTTIEMARPREIADNAIKANKAAHEALVEVVRAIAHAMGLDLGEKNKETATSTSSTSPQGAQNQ